MAKRRAVSGASTGHLLEYSAISLEAEAPSCRAQIAPLRQAGLKRNATSSTKGRKKNSDYRVHEHLTEDQMAKLLAALKRNRHGHRDWLIGLLIYRHGLRVSEACDLRWDDLDLPKRTIQTVGYIAAYEPTRQLHDRQTAIYADNISSVGLSRNCPERIRQ